jgi:hypothetical protein
MMVEGAKQDNYVGRVAGHLRTRLKRKTVLIACAIILMLPFPTTGFPEWRVRVIDAGGAPVAGATVRLWRQDYTLGSDDYVERRAGADGYAVIPKQRVWASLLRRGTFPISEAILSPINIHGSSGLHAHAMAVVGSNSSEMVVLDIHKSLPAEIVMRR